MQLLTGGVRQFFRAALDLPRAAVLKLRMELEMMMQPTRTHRFAAPILALLFLLGIAAEAQAAFIVHQTATQTVSGENFNFVFSGLAPSDGSGATLTIHARGDYSKFSSADYVTWDLDSLGIGGDIGPKLDPSTIIAEYPPTPFNDTEWAKSIAISELDLFTALVDGAVTVSVNLNLEPFGGVVCCFPDTGTPFVTVALEYRPVPEPTAALLFALGFGGVGWRCKARSR
jgi:hypothetical protein